MTNRTEEMIEFNIKCREKFINILGQIIKEGIDRGDIRKESQDLVSALSFFGLGLVVETHTAELVAKDEINSFLDALFKLIEPSEKPQPTKQPKTTILLK